MRSSMIRTVSTTIVAAVALAACGGHGVVPAQGVAPSISNGIASNGFAAGPDGKTSPCNIKGMYYFHGSCRPFNLNMTKATTVKLGQFAPYQGITITTTFSAFTNPPKVQSVSAVMGDAIGKNNDITGTVKGKAFPLYGAGKDCVYNGKPATCPGKPFVYAELINKSQYTLKPQLTPKFVITDSNGFPTGKHNQCFPAELTVKGWLPQTNVHGTPKNHTLIINALRNTQNLYYPANAQFIVAGVCW